MFKPEVGLSTLFCLNERFPKMTRRIVNTDTTCIEIVDEGFHALNKRRVQTLTELAASYGLKYTVHAPFADINIASPSRPLLTTMLKRLKKSVLNASAIGCEVWVFHPGLKTGISDFYPGVEWAQNLETICGLFRFAADYDVKAAIENVPEPFPFIMKNVQGFTRFYSEVDEDIGLVFDIGHANINGQIELFVNRFADKIVHVHAHDNHGRWDKHLGVGHGNVDWEKVANLLREIRYDKIVIVESIEQVDESVNTLRRILA